MSADPSSPPFEIDVQEAAQALAGADPPVLIDVRNPDEYETARIAGSRLIPLPEFAAAVDGLEGLRDRPIIVHCHHGGRSARVVAWLVQNGYDAVNLDGGMGAWDAAGRPMVSETGRPPTVV